MIVTPGCSQNIGARSSQQDAFGFSDIDDRRFANHAGMLAVVADGMGGMANGGEASHLAVKVFLSSYMSKPAAESIPNALTQALADANNAVYQFAKSAGQVENTGTTLVAAVVHGQNLYWISVGDSRLYLCRRGRLTQVNEDHLYAHELDREAAAGKITQSEALNHPERGALTSHLGQPKPEEIDCNVKPFPLEAGDRLMLCSDGLYAALNDQEMARALGAKSQDAADSLVNQILNKKRPGQDNFTVAILSCEEEPSAISLTRKVTSPVLTDQKAQPARGKVPVLIAMLVLVMLASGAGLGGYWWYDKQYTSVNATNGKLKLEQQIAFIDWLKRLIRPETENTPPSDESVVVQEPKTVTADTQSASAVGEVAVSDSGAGSPKSLEEAAADMASEAAETVNKLAEAAKKAAADAKNFAEKAKKAKKPAKATILARKAKEAADKAKEAADKAKEAADKVDIIAKATKKAEGAVAKAREAADEAQKAADEAQKAADEAQKAAAAMVAKGNNKGQNLGHVDASAPENNGKPPPSKNAGASGAGKIEEVTPTGGNRPNRDGNSEDGSVVTTNAHGVSIVVPQSEVQSKASIEGDRK